MTVEHLVLKQAVESLRQCPHCRKPFDYFLRGLIQKTGFELLIEKLVSKILRRKPIYCALICAECKATVGHEDIDGTALLLRKYRGSDVPFFNT